MITIHKLQELAEMAKRSIEEGVLRCFWDSNFINKKRDFKLIVNEIHF
jgi:hypothetical protein